MKEDHGYIMESAKMQVEISTRSFVAPNNGGKEIHLTLGAGGGGNFADQYRALHSALAAWQEDKGKGYAPVFIRFFLSDPANQEIKDVGRFGCAVSVVGQAPLDIPGCKVRMLVIAREGVIQREPAPGVFETMLRDDVKELRTFDMKAPGMDSYKATRDIFNRWNWKLEDAGMTLFDDCVRTWFFVHDIDNNYGGVVKGRNEVFARYGLTPDTHFIVSTGIGGDDADSGVTVKMDGYAVKGLPEGSIRYLYGSSHLNPTHEYGVAFERGVIVDFGDRQLAMISGTASIDNRGQIMHEHDVCRQTERMLENIEVLLAEGEFTPEDMMHGIVYLRDISDASAVKDIISGRYPGLPLAIVKGAVCRPGWLVEMECMALK